MLVPRNQRPNAVSRIHTARESFDRFLNNVFIIISWMWPIRVVYGIDCLQIKILHDFAIERAADLGPDLSVCRYGPVVRTSKESASCTFYPTEVSIAKQQHHD